MVISSISALKTTAGSDSLSFCHVLGYHTKADGGGGGVFWDPSSTEPEDGGTIFQVSGIVTGRWKRLLINSTINIRWFGAKGDGLHDDAPFIRSSINYLRKVGGGILDFPLATYYLNSVENPLPYESASPIIRIPNIPVILNCNGCTFKAGNKLHKLCFIQTTFGASSPFKLLGKPNFEGTGNDGGSNYALIDGIVLNGSSNGILDVGVINKTKRHGIYIMCNARFNTINIETISNTNREMLGVGVQLEGASFNKIHVRNILNVGANAVDFNTWVPHNPLYPASPYMGSPYPAARTYNSSHNILKCDLIDGTGINNSASYNPDDDYFALNCIQESNHNCFEFLEIKNVRPDSGTIPPALSSYLACFRLWACKANNLRTKIIDLVGHSENGKHQGDLIRITAASDNIVHIDTASQFRNILRNDNETQNDSSGNYLSLKNSVNELSENLTRGLSLKFIQKESATNSNTGVLSGFKVDYGITIDLIQGSFRISTDGSGYKSIRKTITEFNADFLLFKFTYRASASIQGSNPVVNIQAHNFPQISLIKDENWHTTTFIIRRDDIGKDLFLSPSNSAVGTGAGSWLELRDLCFISPDGSIHRDSSPTKGYINAVPTIGTFEVGDEIFSDKHFWYNGNSWIIT